MISIRPKWCEKICSGEKTIEVRKTRPKLETPFKCYIYCTVEMAGYANADAGNGGYYFSIASFIVTLPGVDEEGACEFADSGFEFQKQYGATFDRRFL